MNNEQGDETHAIYQRWKSSLHQPTTTKETRQTMTEQAQPEFVDINNMSLEDEPLGAGFDAEADAFAMPEPPDDDTYVVSVKHQETNPEKRWIKKERNDQEYYETRIACQIVRGARTGEKFAGRYLFDSFMSTEVGDSGTSRVAGLLTALGQKTKVTEARGHVTLARSLSAILAAEPQCNVTTKVTAREKGHKNFLAGQARFPQKANGRPDYQKVRDDGGPQSGDEVFIEAKIMSYAPIGQPAPAIKSPMSAGGFSRSA